MADDKTTKTPEQPVTDSGPGKETPPAPPKEPGKVSVSPKPEKKTEPEVKNPQVSVYTAIVRSHFFPATYAGPPCPCPLYAGHESERYCRNGRYHTIAGGKIHPRCTAEVAPVLCASEMDGQSMSVSKEKRCIV